MGPGGTASSLSAHVLAKQVTHNESPNGRRAGFLFATAVIVLSPGVRLHGAFFGEKGVYGL